MQLSGRRTLGNIVYDYEMCNPGHAPTAPLISKRHKMDPMMQMDYDYVQGNVLRSPHGTAPARVTINKV